MVNVIENAETRTPHRSDYIHKCPSCNGSIKTYRDCTGELCPECNPIGQKPKGACMQLMAILNPPPLEDVDLDIQVIKGDLKPHVDYSGERPKELSKRQIKEKEQAEGLVFGSSKELSQEAKFQKKAQKEKSDLSASKTAENFVKDAKQRGLI